MATRPCGTGHQIGVAYNANWEQVPANRYFFKAELDEFHVYDHALTESEIRAMAIKEK